MLPCHHGLGSCNKLPVTAKFTEKGLNYSLSSVLILAKHETIPKSFPTSLKQIKPILEVTEVTSSVTEGINCWTMYILLGTYGKGVLHSTWHCLLDLR